MHNALRIVIALALAAHGIGHSIGFGVAVPFWFAVAWLLPGVGFVLGAWGFLRNDQWWEPLIAASALASLALEILTGVALQDGPYASAAVFNLLALGLLVIERTRHELAHISSEVKHASNAPQTSHRVR